MRTEIRTSHANEADKQQKVLVLTHFRHVMAAIGFHPRYSEVSVGGMSLPTSPSAEPRVDSYPFPWPWQQPFPYPCSQ
eukprot:13942266-Heterocapsa_arctica.AAC.1